MSVESYAAFPEFAGLLLEESRITRITDGSHSLRFEAEVAVLGDHPLHQVPRAGEIHSYAQVRMTATGQVTWLADRRGDRVLRVTDADGLRHFGTFTHFEAANSRWLIEGPWGSVEVRDATWRITAR